MPLIEFLHIKESLSPALTKNFPHFLICEEVEMLSNIKKIIWLSTSLVFCAFVEERTASIVHFILSFLQLNNTEETKGIP